MGCAGFNKTLGPVRPVMRALTAAYFVWAWVRALGARSPKSRTSLRLLALSTAVCAALTLLPEALLLSGRGLQLIHFSPQPLLTPTFGFKVTQTLPTSQYIPQPVLASSREEEECKPLLSGGPALAAPTVGAQLITLDVEGMGCEACQVWRLLITCTLPPSNLLLLLRMLCAS